MPRITRLKSGWSGFSVSARYSLREMPRAKPFGSNEGRLANTSTSPFDGSIATTAPRRPAIASSATRCSSMSIVRRNSRPACGSRLCSCASASLKQLHRAALGVDEHFAVSADAQQLLLVGALDAGLADHAGPEIALAVDAREVVLADRADVTERMRADRPVRVMARHAGFEQDARQLVPVHGVARDLLVVELEQEWNGLERAARQHELAHARDVGRIEQSESRQAGRA